MSIRKCKQNYDSAEGGNAFYADFLYIQKIAYLSFLKFLATIYSGSQDIAPIESI